NTRAASEPAERRSGAPVSAPTSGRNGGSHSANVRAPRGEESSVIGTQGAPHNSAANSAGSADVADASRKTGSAPYARGIRSNIGRKTATRTEQPHVRDECR